MEKIISLAERYILKWRDNQWLLKYMLGVYFFVCGQKRAADAMDFAISLVADMNSKYMWTRKKAVVTELVCAKISEQPRLYWNASLAKPFVAMLLQAIHTKAEYDGHLWFFTECALRCAVAARDISALPDILSLLNAFNEGQISPSRGMDVFDAQVAHPGILAKTVEFLGKAMEERTSKKT